MGTYDDKFPAPQLITGYHTIYSGAAGCGLFHSMQDSAAAEEYTQMRELCYPRTLAITTHWPSLAWSRTKPTQIHAVLPFLPYHVVFKGIV